MRNAFISTLCQQATVHEDIFLLCGDLGYSVLEPFAAAFPERFLNVGIAEQNMTQIATGLALEGFNVFTYSIGNFPTLRCMEQIRYDVCYHGANVKIVAVGAGYAYGPLGASHHTTEDLAMLRSIPDLLVTAPGDPVEAAALARFLVCHRGPAYVRLNKAGEPSVHRAPLELERGRLIPVRGGRDVAVLTTGAVLEAVVRELDGESLPWGVYSAPFLSCIDENDLLRLVQGYSCIVTVEEHQLNGGFGSAVLEKLNDLRANGRLDVFPPVHRVGIPNVFIGVAGNQDYLREQAGINLRSVRSALAAG
jgi:transketolase